MVYGIRFQPPSSCFHHGKYGPFALAGWWEWSDVVNLPGLTTPKSKASPPVPGRLYPHGSFDCSTDLTLMGNLCDGLKGQVQPSVTSPCGCGIPP